MKMHTGFRRDISTDFIVKISYKKRIGGYYGKDNRQKPYKRI
jgi:hypothetical protein